MARIQRTVPGRAVWAIIFCISVSWKSIKGKRAKKKQRMAKASNLPVRGVWAFSFPLLPLMEITNRNAGWLQYIFFSVGEGDYVLRTIKHLLAKLIQIDFHRSSVTWIENSKGFFFFFFDHDKQQWIHVEKYLLLGPQGLLGSLNLFNIFINDRDDESLKMS